MSSENFQFLLKQECLRAERYLHFFTMFRVAWEGNNTQAKNPSPEDVAQLLGKTLRQSDLIGMTRDACLALLLPHVELENAAEIEDRIREKIVPCLGQNSQGLNIKWICFPTHTASPEDFLEEI